MSLIDYVMNRDGVEFMDAVKRLAATVGLTPPGVKNSLVSSIVDKRRNSGFDYQPPPGQDYLPGNLVSKAGRNYKNNNFIQYLKSIFGPESTRQAIHKYLIGTSDYWPGGTIFWQIDDHGRVRHGKIMLYNPETGKRVKEPRPHIYSVAKLKGLKDFNLKQCLFGLHLLIESDSDMVAIVEAEKTATAMSIIKPQVPWMATGSKHGFNYEMLKPLRNKHIMAYPDKGEYLGWQAEALDLNDIGFNIRVDDTLENSLLPKGTDLADLVLQHENNSGIRKCDQVSDQKVRIFPKTIYREEDQSAMRIHTKSERDVLRLAKKNPSILKLVEVFDLTHPNGNNLHLPKW